MKWYRLPLWALCNAAGLYWLFAAQDGGALATALLFFVWAVHVPLAGFLALLLNVGWIACKATDDDDALAELGKSFRLPTWFRVLDLMFDMLFATLMASVLGWMWTAAAYWLVSLGAYIGTSLVAPTPRDGPAEVAA